MSGKSQREKIFMNVVYQILFDAGRLLSYFLIMLSFIISGLILFKPKIILRLSDWLNSLFCTERIGKKMDSTVDTTETLLKYRWLIGSVFLIGSLFTAHYAYVVFDPKRFVSLVIRPPGERAIQGYFIIFEGLRWLFVFISSVGAAACSCMMFMPGLFRKINGTFDREVSTEKFRKALDRSHGTLDQWVLKHHILVGSFLFLASSYLVVIFLFISR